MGNISKNNGTLKQNNPLTRFLLILVISMEESLSLISKRIVIDYPYWEQ